MVLPGTLLTEPDWLTDRVAQIARQTGSPDRRINATLWWYSASVVLLGPAVRSLVLIEEAVDLSPAALRFTLRAGGYLERVVPGPAADRLASPTDLGRQLDDALGPVIEPLAAVGGTSRQSLWAIATDSLATVVLAATSVSPAGSLRAAALATAIAAASSRVRPLPRFTDVAGERAGTASVSRYVRRASCCLLYRVPDGKCISCPNQPPAERLDRLTRHADSQP